MESVACVAVVGVSITIECSADVCTAAAGLVNSNDVDTGPVALLEKSLKMICGSGLRLSAYIKFNDSLNVSIKWSTQPNVVVEAAVAAVVVVVTLTSRLLFIMLLLTPLPAVLQI